MTTMEPRVAERRRGVSEDKARRRLRWILGIIGLIAAVGFGFWIVRSPVLSISSITVSGAELSNPQTVIDEMREYFSALAGARRSDPREDLLSGLVAAELEGSRLSIDEMLQMLILLLVAGNETNRT